MAWYFAALAIVLFCAVSNLYLPFVADQTVALLGAMAIDHGGILYVDFWDNKMPGLFWFYYVAGELFGYNERGVHILEIIWMVSFSFAMMWTLRRYFCYPWFSALAPVAVVAVYYVCSEPFLSTQLEILVGFPIFLSAWCVTRLSPDSWQRRSMSLLSGVCAGVTVVFKLVFAPLFVMFWLLASVYAGAHRKLTFKEIATDIWVPAALGGALVLSAVVIKFWFDGALDELIWTAFEYPPQALEQAPLAPHHRLAESLRFFITYYATWSGFIFIAIYYWWRKERDLFTTLMLGWLLLGTVLILIQRFSWWPYHFLALFAPAGILAIRGLSELTRYVVNTSQPRAIGAMTLALAFAIPAVGSIAVPAGQKITPLIENFALQEGTVQSYQEIMNGDYRTIYRSTRFLVDEAALSGNIYVLGDPLYYYLSGRQPALPIIGWPWRFFLNEQWNRLADDLNRTRPNYIYVDGKNKQMANRRGGGVRAFIEEHYIGLRNDHNGSWFILKPKFRRPTLDDDDRASGY